jgi:hypothetical protein
MKNKIQVYTSISGGYDNFLGDPEVLLLDKYDRFKNPKANAKIYKIIPHMFIESEFSIWIDGNVRLKCNPEVLIDMMKDKDILVFRHPNRDCVYQEGMLCAKLGLDDKEVISKQLSRYRDKGWKEHNNLASCRLIVRRNTEEINKLNSLWWSEICSGSVRDQISFPFVYQDFVQYVNHPNSYDNEFFKVFPHKIKLKNKIRFKLTGKFY